MRQQLAVFTLLLAVFTVGLARAGEAPDAALAPDFTLDTASGESFQLSEHRGEKVYLVLFWATWCPFCKALMPHLQSIIEEHGADNVEVLALTIREDGDPAAVLAQQGYAFTLLPDADEVAKRYGVRGTPGLFVIDKQGALAFDIHSRRPATPAGNDELSRRQRAARLAPFWAAHTRIAVATALAD